MGTPTATHYRTRLAEIVGEEGRKQIWLCERTGIDSGSMSRYLAGLHVPDDKRVTIADALGRSIEDVFETEIGAPL